MPAPIAAQLDTVTALRLGLCSVTFRGAPALDVIGAARDAGLRSIEWASDGHVPAGDLRRATLVGEATRAAGLDVCSYGSYLLFPWQQGASERADDVIATAVALGAPRIRVWSGPTASAAADAAGRQVTVDALSSLAARAADVGITIALEFHHGTLTDTAASTVKLLAEIGDDRVSSYWQPRLGASNAEVLEDLDRLGDAVSTVHLFAWGASYERHPLAWREELWRAVLSRALTRGGITDGLIEFLPGDDPASLLGEAAFLADVLAHSRAELSR